MRLSHWLFTVNSSRQNDANCDCLQKRLTERGSIFRLFQPKETVSNTANAIQNHSELVLKKFKAIFMVEAFQKETVSNTFQKFQVGSCISMKLAQFVGHGVLLTVTLQLPSSNSFELIALVRISPFQFCLETHTPILPTSKAIRMLLCHHQFTSND
jgi:hypothetical protein